MKNEICAAIGIVGGAIASLLGGWDTALQTLIIFMAIDYITGLIVAGVFGLKLAARGGPAGHGSGHCIFRRPDS